ncbi:MAG TPA: M48 family metallopeptidase [Candidatus Dormibacteraeota bacterium]|jgi:STE24 endopeptidase|nr:M48 family metallopeptidase [Candidatus Dormibacteraeota bacterium]
MPQRLIAVAMLCVIAVSLSAAQGSPPQSTTQAPNTTTATPPVADASHVQQPAKRITEYSLPPELYKKAKTLGAIRFAFRLFSFFFSLFALWLLLQTKLSAKFRNAAERVTRIRFLQALIFTPLLVISFSLLQLPLDLFNETLLKRYGISVQPWGSWTGDWLKSLLLTAIIGSLFAWILLAVIRRSPQRWWFYFWIISIPIMIFLVFLQPLVIDPMFSKFEPLSAKAPDLIPQLELVTVRGGMPIPPERMFWMLASDKTIYTNAYVTGIGASKRVVIWDTSLAKETTGGILTMFGHEMGHYVLNHIWKGFAFVCAMTFVLLYLGFRTIGWLLARSGAKWEVHGVEDWASLPALMLLVTFFGFAANVVGNTFSRYQENQADIYSLEVTHGIVPDPGQACAASFQMFGEQVFVDPEPNPVNVFLFFDHPTVAHRIHLCATYDPWAKGESPQFVK